MNEEYCPFCNRRDGTYQSVIAFLEEVLGNKQECKLNLEEKMIYEEKKALRYNGTEKGELARTKARQFDSLVLAVSEDIRHIEKTIVILETEE